MFVVHYTLALQAVRFFRVLVCVRASCGDSCGMPGSSPPVIIVPPLFELDCCRDCSELSKLPVAAASELCIPWCIEPFGICISALVFLPCICMSVEDAVAAGTAFASARSALGPRSRASRGTRPRRSGSSCACHRYLVRAAAGPPT
ncbi:hypothetical protein PI125_g9860 [Phytophthora idaei]|nr:hypothetical protein PI125_g9860 [Phytophthora idaei]